MRKAKQKSNLPVYIITFMVTSLILGLFLISVWGDILPKTGGNAAAMGDAKPDAALDTSALFMLGESKGSAPSYFMLLNYRPRGDVIVAVPMRADTAVQTGRNGNVTTLEKAYASGGASGVLNGIKNTFGITCAYYVKFDKSAFVSFAEKMGDVPVNIPHDIEGTDANTSFKAGSQALSAERLYAFLTAPSYGESEDYRYIAHGSVAVSIVNKCAKNLSASTLQNIYAAVQNNADSNFGFKDYTKYQRAFLYTSEHGQSPANFYVPYGTQDEAAANFAMSPAAIETIRTRFGLVDEQTP